MTLLEATILSVVQGLTEFLPVSSSGHLALIQKLMGFSTPPVAFDVLLHLGTLVAVLYFFRIRLIQLISHPCQERQYISYLLIATIPAVIAGFLFESKIEATFSSFSLLALFFTITGLFLLSTRLITQGHRSDKLTTSKAIIIGLFQAVALLPGVSRSGSTITGALWQKLTPEKAFEFSFLLSIPAIFGAALLKLKDLSQIDVSLTIGLAAFIVSAIIGYLSLILVGKVIRQGRLNYFGYYCLFLALLIVLLS